MLRSPPAARRQASTNLGPRVVEVEREGEPPDEVVREAEDDCRRGPRPTPDELREADGAENLSREPDGREQPAALGRARHLEVDNPVEPDDHPEAGENLRVVLRGQRSEERRGGKECRSR